MRPNPEDTGSGDDTGNGEVTRRGDVFTNPGEVTGSCGGVGTNSEVTGRGEVFSNPGKVTRSGDTTPEFTGSGEDTNPGEVSGSGDNTCADDAVNPGEFKTRPGDV